jgi:hypothetical protein
MLNQPLAWNRPFKPTPTTRPDDARWFSQLGACQKCGKPSTGVLMNVRNESLGPYCQKCAEKRLSQAFKEITNTIERSMRVPGGAQ